MTEAGSRGATTSGATTATGLSRWVGGVDIGGTSVRTGWLRVGSGGSDATGEVTGEVTGDATGEVADSRGARNGDGAGMSIPDPPLYGLRHLSVAEVGEEPRAIAKAVAAMLRESAECVGVGKAAGVGVGVPGPLDLGRRVVVEALNLRWRDAPLADMIEDETGWPVVLENDADCAAMAEWRYGWGRGAKRLVGLTVGTGIGGGIVLDGDLYRGASGAAAEVGHVVIDRRGRTCGCGQRGGVEAYAAGTAIGVIGRERGVGSAAAAPSGRAAPVTGEAVCGAASAGDETALGVVADAARSLAVAVVGLVRVLDPDVIVVGGGVAAAGAIFFDPLIAEVRRRAFPSTARNCRIVPSALAGRAGMLGAAWLCARQIPQLS